MKKQHFGRNLNVEMTAIFMTSGAEERGQR
jgi:hypothetical protein